MLEQALRVPAREIAVGKVLNLFAQLRFDLVGSKTEVVAHARHALALKLECTARIRGQLRLFQIGIDASLGGMKLPDGHQANGRIQITVVGGDGREPGCCRRQGHRQQYGQHHGTRKFCPCR